MEVKAEAEPVEHTSAADASVVNSEQIANLPVNGRDWAELTILAPFAQDFGETQPRFWAKSRRCQEQLVVIYEGDFCPPRKRRRNFDPSFL